MIGAGFVVGKPDPWLARVASKTLERCHGAALVFEPRGWRSWERRELHRALDVLAPKS
jgi:hypothetical protein